MQTEYHGQNKLEKSHVRVERGLLLLFLLQDFSKKLIMTMLTFKFQEENIERSIFPNSSDQVTLTGYVLKTYCEKH